jgi:hypothetical protein
MFFKQLLIIIFVLMGHFLHVVPGSGFRLVWGLIYTNKSRIWI